MKKNMSQEVAFDIFADFMSRMIQKYGDSIDIPKDNQSHRSYRGMADTIKQWV